MKLVDDLNTTIINPTPSQIRDIIIALTRDDAFAIYELEEQIYMQVSGTVESGFVLEYREGSEDKHFGVYNRSLSAEEVIIAFCEFSDSKDDYKTRYVWEKTF